MRVLGGKDSTNPPLLVCRRLWLRISAAISDLGKIGFRQEACPVGQDPNAPLAGGYGYTFELFVDPGLRPVPRVLSLSSLQRDRPPLRASRGYGISAALRPGVGDGHAPYGTSPPYFAASRYAPITGAPVSLSPNPVPIGQGLGRGGSFTLGAHPSRASAIRRTRLDRTYRSLASCGVPPPGDRQITVGLAAPTLRVGVGRPWRRLAYAVLSRRSRQES